LREPLPSVRVRGEGFHLLVDEGVLMVYRKWVEPPRGLEPGSLVVVESPRGDVVGCAFYDTVGPVALRVVEVGGCSFSSPEEAVRSLIARAYDARRRLGLAGGGDAGYRLVHSDGDYLPGLIVDVYSDIAVVQSSSIVWDTHMELLVEAIVEAAGADTVYEKSTQRTRRDIGLPPREGHRRGSKVRTVIREGDAQFIVDVRLGQKTGFFLDQRLNRIEFGRLASGRVLDLFSYTGGFGIHALVNGAERAVFVEEDEKAISILRENLRLNRVADRAEVRPVNVWEFLNTAKGGGFDAVAVDPPAFIPDPKARRRGMMAYERLYTKAAQLAGTGGLLFLSSCSTHLRREEFAAIVSRALARAGRPYVSLGSIRGLPPDHTARPSAPHLDYLKSIFLILY
jgi:23S rRNA (cytosine1962-C5)-methyltransferase